MLLLIAAVALAAPTSVDRWTPSAAVQARATVRIISGVRLKLDSATNPDAPPAHDSTVRTGEDGPQPARLIEFE